MSGAAVSGEARRLLLAQCRSPVTPEVAALTHAALAKFGTGVAAVLFYGSCRRTLDASAGVVDLYVVVDARRGVEPGWRAWLGGVLPPNVYYLQISHSREAGHSLEPGQGSDQLRAKIGVFTLAELQRASASFESYVWGRLAQPVSLVYVRDEQTEGRIVDLLGACVLTFLDNALPLLPGAAVAEVWREGLSRSYRTELRVETAGRAADIVAADAPYYEQLTLACAASRLDRTPVGVVALPDPAAAYVGWRWRLRNPVGKLLSVLRLIKGLYTFDGGLDYMAWKLARHAGRPIEIPERVRRWPLIFVWGLMWRLYRQGVLR